MSDYETLIAVQRDNARYAEWERDQPPEYCPYDGAILQENDEGVRNCPMGNFRYEP